MSLGTKIQNNTQANSDGAKLPLPARNASISTSKIYERNIQPTYKIFYTVTNPATGTKSIRLPADAQLADEIVPFSHLALYAKELPHANMRKIVVEINAKKE